MVVVVSSGNNMSQALVILLPTVHVMAAFLLPRNAVDDARIHNVISVVRERLVFTQLDFGSGTMNSRCRNGNAAGLLLLLLLAGLSRLEKGSWHDRLTITTVIGRAMMVVHGEAIGNTSR